MQQPQTERKSEKVAEITCQEAIFRTALYSVAAAAVTVSAVYNGREVSIL